MKDVHGKLCTRADSLNEERGIVNFKNVYGTHEVKNGSKTMLLEPNAHIAAPPPPKHPVHVREKLLGRKFMVMEVPEME